MSTNVPIARYTLSIVTDSGYETTEEGDCTPHQYSMAISALRDAPHTSQELQKTKDELLALLVEFDSTMTACSDCPDMPHEIDALVKVVTKARGVISKLSMQR